MTVKVSNILAEQLKKAGTSDLIEIILELYPEVESGSKQGPETRSRGEKIAAKKEAFSQNLAPVEEAIRKAGGEITGTAWINQTVRARVPAQRVKELSGHEKVAALDTPHPLKPDVIK